jgi:hypothetical protein
MLTARQYDPAQDQAFVCEWWGAHNDEWLQANLLPPVGVVVEKEGAPVAACWLYLAVGIGVCWLEFPVFKPGLTLKEAREVFAVGLGALEQIALKHDYGVMIAHASPSVLRGMRGFGFVIEEQPKKTAVKLLR